MRHRLDQATIKGGVLINAGRSRDQCRCGDAAATLHARVGTTVAQRCLERQQALANLKSWEHRRAKARSVRQSTM